MGSWLSGMKNLGSNREDSDSNTLKCKFLDSNWPKQSVLGLSGLFLLYMQYFLAVSVVCLT